MIILSILITLSLDIVWITLGENWCWSPLGLKGLIWLTKEMLVSFILFLLPSCRVKPLCTGHRWRKTKDLFVFCSGKNLLGIVSWFLFFCFMSSVSGAQSKCQLYTDRFLLLNHTFLYHWCCLPSCSRWFYSQARSSVPPKIPLMNLLFESWVRWPL